MQVRSFQSDPHPEPGITSQRSQSQPDALREVIAPDDPLYWTGRRKIVQITIISLYTLLVFASLSVEIPIYSTMSEQLDLPDDVLDISYAGNSVALALGCVVFVPFALILGRKIIYVLTSVIMLSCTIWSARTQTAGDVIGASVVMGLAGAVNECLYQMTIVDLFPVHRRGTLNGVYLTMVTIGNYLAPVASGYVAKSQGWRWPFWWTSIFLATVSILLLLFLEETKPITGSSNRNTQAANTKLHTHNTGNVIQILRTSKTTYDIWRGLLFPAASSYTIRQVLRLFWEPFRALYIFPVITLSALQYGFYLSVTNIMALTQSTLYAQLPYSFSNTAIGNLSFAPAIGTILGSVTCGVLSDKATIILAKSNGGIYEPEMRLRLIVLPALSMTAGTFLYGLAIAKGMPWIISSVGAALVGFGLGGAGDLLLSYIQDSYTLIVGLALIGVTFLCNLLSGALLLAYDPLQINIGVYNAFILLGCLSALMNLLNIPMMIWGKHWRHRSDGKYRALAKAQAGEYVSS